MTVSNTAIVEAFRGKYSSAVVGLLSCQINSCLKELTTKVVSCREIGPAADSKADPKEGPKGDAKKAANKDGDKKKKKADGKDTPTAQKESPFKAKFEVELEDTILFPEGGGQPSDTGLITILSSQTQIPVYYVRREGMIALHQIPSPIEVGTEVSVKVDWKRRFDQMQQHTGQHLLSAILDKKGIETVSWSMGSTVEKSNFESTSEKPNTTTKEEEKISEFPNVNYIELERKVTREEIEQVQEELNDTISQMLDISVEIPADQSPADIDGNDKGVIRHIKIGSLDCNPCCGTHLKSTAHVMALSLFKNTQTIRGTNCRLFFVAGNRVSQYASAANDKIKKVNAALSSTTETIEDKIGEINAQLKSARVGEKYWLGETATQEGQNLKSLIAQQFVNAEQGSITSSKNPDLKYNGHVVYMSKGNMDFFRAVEKEMGSLDELSKKSKVPFAIVFAGGQVKETGVIIIVGTSADVINDVAATIKERIPDVKGGGKGKWQGKVVEWTQNGIKHIETLFTEN